MRIQNLYILHSFYFTQKKRKLNKLHIVPIYLYNLLYNVQIFCQYKNNIKKKLYQT